MVEVGSRYPIQPYLSPQMGGPRVWGLNREPWQAGRWLGVGDVDRGGQEESGRETTGSGGAEVK